MLGSNTLVINDETLFKIMEDYLTLTLFRANALPGSVVVCKVTRTGTGLVPTTSIEFVVSASDDDA